MNACLSGRLDVVWLGYCHRASGPSVSSPGTRHQKGRRQTLPKICVSSSKEDDTVCIFAWLSVVKVSSCHVNFRGEGPKVFYLKKKKNQGATFQEQDMHPLC